VGKYAGAKNEKQTYRAIHYSFGWGMGLALLYSLIYWFFGPALLRVFTNQADVIAATTPYLYWMAVFPLLSTPCYIWDGVFIGLTASKAMRNSMLLAIAVYLGLYYGWAQEWDNHGLWLVLLVFMVARGGFQQVLYWRRGLNLD
jgi:MATE family multidrug resistance protein